MSLRKKFEMSKERLRNIFWKEFIEPKGLRKIRNILRGMGFVIFAFFIGSNIDSSLTLYSSVAFFIALLILFLLLYVLKDLQTIFSKAILDGNPKTPSKQNVIYLFSVFLLLIILICAGLFSALFFQLPILLYLFIPLAFFLVFPYLLRHVRRMKCSIKFVLAGRVFTYMSPATILYLVIAYLAFFFFDDLLRSYKIPNLGLPVGMDVILFVAVLVPLTFLFFWTKERIFSHYGKVLISRKSEKYSRRKKIFEGTLKELLGTVAEIDEADVDRLYKRAYLIKLKIEFLDQQIKEIEKEFEFHGSLTLNVITQPFWIVLIIEVIPRVFDFLRELLQ